MSFLVGSETEGAGASEEIKAAKALAFQFEASFTGTAEKLKVRLVSILGTHLLLALLTDSAGKPGTVIAEGEQTLPGTSVEVAVTPVEVARGTKYWLAVLPIGGNCFVKTHGAGGTGSSESTNVAITKITEATWGTPGTLGPMFIAATGTKGTQVQSFNATLTAAGTLPRRITKVLQASLTPGGSLGRRIARALVATLTPAGTLGRGTVHFLFAELFVNQSPANEVLNPSLELGIGANNWKAGYETKAVAQSATQARYGTHSLAITPQTGATQGLFVEEHETPLWVTGRIYSGRCSVYFPTAGKYHVYFTDPESVTTLESDQGEYTASGAEWHDFTWTNKQYAKADKGNHFIVRITKVGLFSESETVYIDGIQRVQGATLPAYADGGQAGYYWAGMPERSRTYTIVEMPGRNIARKLAALVTPTGMLRGTVSHAFAAKLEPIGVLPRSVLRQLAAGLEPRGGMLTRITRTLAGTVAPEGSLHRNIAHSLASTIAPTGALPRAVIRASTATLAPEGRLGRSIALMLGAIVAPEGIVRSRIMHGFAARLEPVGNLRRAFVEAFIASLTPVGALPRRTSHALLAVLAPEGSTQRQVVRQLAANVMPAATLSLGLVRTLSATLAPSGTLRRRTVHQFTAMITGESRLGRAISYGFAATLTLAARLVAHRPLVPTSLVVVTRCPSALECASRSPVELAEVSRAPTTLRTETV